MTTEAYKRGFKNLSQFARYAMEFLIATDHRRTFDDFNRMIEASERELATGKSQVPAGSISVAVERLVKKGLLL